MNGLVTDPAWGDGVLFIAMIPIAMVAVLAFVAGRDAVLKTLQQRRLRRVLPGAVAVTPLRRHPRPQARVPEQRGRTTPAEAMNRCAFCGHVVQLTVDDTGLCLRCDVLLFPPLDYSMVAGS